MVRTWEDPPEYRPDDAGGPDGMGGTPQFALPQLTRATRRLLIVNSAIYAVSFVVFLASKDAWAAIERTLGLRPAAWTATFPLVPIWQPLTYGFLHSVTDIFHILLNLLTLYFFGTMLEEMIGTRRFVLAYFSAQLAGALFFLVPGVLGLESGVAIGASGAVYGVMVAMATLRPRQRVLFLFIPVTLGFLALVFLAITLFGAALQWKEHGGGGVAHLVHLGGIAYGFLAVKTRLIFADPLAALARSRAAREVERRQSDDARVDQILEKINREGMSALSRGEREFLKRVSSRR
jgi:membrane associated rhomboid family serine protease